MSWRNCVKKVDIQAHLWQVNQRHTWAECWWVHPHEIAAWRPDRSLESRNLCATGCPALLSHGCERCPVSPQSGVPESGGVSTTSLLWTALRCTARASQDLMWNVETKRPLSLRGAMLRNWSELAHQPGGLAAHPQHRPRSKSLPHTGAVVSRSGNKDCHDLQTQFVNCNSKDIC